MLAALEGTHKLFKSHCNSAARGRFVAERVVRIWNSLPPTTTSATLFTFRPSIKCVNFSAFKKSFLKIIFC